MKIIHCRECNDVLGLRDDEWRRCKCGASAGRYDPNGETALVAGEAAIYAICNLYLRLPSVIEPGHEVLCEPIRRLDGALVRHVRDWGEGVKEWPRANATC